MGDPVSVTTSVVALVTFGIQAGNSLRKLIESFDKHTKIVRDLKTDLKSLDEVLKELAEVANNDIGKTFISLQLPLHSCGQICQEFDALIRRCASNTTDTRRSVRDWSKLQLQSDDINAFRTTLSGYKSTIQIALGGINLRTSEVTIECLRDYKILITDTKADLKEQLDRIESQLANTSDPSSSTTAYLEWITSQHRVEEEKGSITKCLEICEEVSTYIEGRQRTAFLDISAKESKRHDSVVTAQASNLSSAGLTTRKLSECREKIALARDELEIRLSSLPGDGPSDELPRGKRLQSCLAMCDEALCEAEQARISAYEDVSTEEDSRQYIVSTIGDLISAKRVTAGPRSMMLLGQLSDQSLQASFTHFATTSADAMRTSHTKGGAQTPAFAKYGTGRPLAERTDST